jgi:hypothetical protein
MSIEVLVSKCIDSRPNLFEIYFCFLSIPISFFIFSHHHQIIQVKEKIKETVETMEVDIPETHERFQELGSCNLGDFRLTIHSSRVPRSIEARSQELSNHSTVRDHSLEDGDSLDLMVVSPMFSVCIDEEARSSRS